MRILWLLIAVIFHTDIVYSQDWIKLAAKQDSAEYLRKIKASDYKIDKNRSLEQISYWVTDNSISGDSLYQLLRNWNQYPVPSKTGIICEFSLQLDSNYTVPYLVYIPKGYDPKRASSLLVYYKGGWLSRKERPANYAKEIITDNLTFSYLDKENIIELFPVLDSKLAIYGYYGYKHLTEMIAATKKLLNIDDNKVFLSGFSDGGKTVYNAYSFLQSPFACFYAINGMFVSPPEYANFVNRPVVSFVAEKDELTVPKSILTKALFAQKLGADWNYRLMKDKRHYYKPYQSVLLPVLFAHLKTQSRNPIPSTLTYHSSTNYEDFHGVDWLQVKVNTKKTPSLFHRTDSVYTFAGDGEERSYLYGANSGQAQAKFLNNTFTITASQLDEVTIYISPLMVDMNSPVKVIVNGKELFNDKVSFSKSFMAERFLYFFDRQQVWVNKIVVAVE